MEKRILITGADSYIGTSFEKYIKQFDGYRTDTVDMRDASWKQTDFSAYDVVLHVSGIVHIKETNETRSLYYKVNRDLTVETAELAKKAGVGQFIFLSTMSVYGVVTGHITPQTPCRPVNAYGKSKLMAEEELLKMQSDSFCTAILRPPMVYGKNCKGNYQQLRSFALKSPVFPKYTNERSMLYIDNLCFFLKELIDKQKSGLFFPQNAEYVNTSEMTALIAENHKKKIRLWRVFSPFIKIAPGNTVKKVFGSLTYEKTDVIDAVGFEQSIKQSEG